MARTRRQSVPPPNRQSQDGRGRSPNAVQISSLLASISSPDDKPCPPADALARMTIELNMRAISTQAQRLERDLQLLVQATQQDQEFREQNQGRMNEIWKELVAVKARVNEVHGGQEDASVRYERHRQETTASLEVFRKEMGDFRSLCGSIESQLETLPTMADLDLLTTQPLPDDCGIRRSTGVDMNATRRAQQEDSKVSADQLRRIIREVLASTRRWNREHKTTRKPESLFIAEYLRRQSKSHVQLAVHIQRAIRRHVRLRRPDVIPRSNNLEGFCRSVKWQDVLDVVEDLLVSNEERTINTLV